MFSLFEGAQKKLNNLLDYVAVPEDNSNSQAATESLSTEDTRPVDEVSINTAAIAGKVFSYAKIASNVAQQNANKLTNLVSQTSVLSTLSKQQEQFKESLSNKSADIVDLPWEGLPNEDEIKKRFLELSQNPNVFLEDAPVEVQEEFGPLAKKLLEFDENLSKLRYELVPKKLSEERFWRNYLYRVSLLAKIIKEENSIDTNEEIEDFSQSSTSRSKEVEAKIKSDEKIEEPMSKELKILEKSSPTEDDDWEKELLNAEFDMVKETNDENWEEDLNELLESCKTEK